MGTPSLATVECDRAGFFAALSGLRLLAVGDVMLDRYLQGSVSRVAAEAPVLVVRLGRTWSVPGGAGRVAACLAGIGCRVTVTGLVGADEAGAELCARLESAGVEEPDLLPCAVRTTTKTRVLADTAQHLLRLDDDPDPVPIPESGIGTRIAPRIREFDAVVVSDYDKGSLPHAEIRAVLDAARAADVPVIIDPKKEDMRVYAGCRVLTPNATEAERATGIRVERDPEGAALHLRATCRAEVVLITRGPDGMTGADEAGVFHIPARARLVADATGAGDTVAAVLAAAVAAGISVRAGCELGAIAAGIAVGRNGDSVVRAEELRAAVEGRSEKIVSAEGAAALALRERARGRTVVFTNGCFDLLHPGHLYSLERAREEGHFLIVGVNSDASVRLLKGPGRPVLPLDQRLAMLCGLGSVDAVVVFDAPTPEPLIRLLDPDVLVKGGDYTPETVVGADFVRSRGGRVVVVPRLTSLSTSGLLGHIARASNPSDQ
jgi:D-beta-D-heptose 7-phosphate kinase/D-beta-D-heptose 1-phosphate adenosyltransferase